jgi:hypothetical protein
MRGQNPDQFKILTFAVVLLIPALGVAWKAAGWRGDTFKKWMDRVKLAHAGLHEKVTSELVALQDDITDMLAGGMPAEVWVDPSPLVSRANRCAVLLRARDKLQGRFRRYCRLATFLIPTVTTYLLGWLGATFYFTQVVHKSWLKFAGFGLGGLAIAATLAIFISYAYFESKLTKAEEMAAGTR